MSQAVLKRVRTPVLEIAYEESGAADGTRNSDPEKSNKAEKQR